MLGLPPPAPERRRSRRAKVEAEQVEVRGIYHVIPVEVGSRIVACVAKLLTEGVPEYVEIGRVHQVIIVAVADPHQTHLGLRGGRARERNLPRFGQVNRSLDPPVVSTVR